MTMPRPFDSFDDFKPHLTQPPLTSPTTLSISLPSLPVIRFVFLCSLWYTTSALSSNTGKQIMNQFRFPITLTFIQFGFVSAYCLLFANPWYGWTRIRRPNMIILRNTFPMAVFQVGGHIFSSMAISRVPVSTVHTIKALSPLFTVAAYALLFRVRYSVRTYASLLPLTFGVMLACSFDLNLNNALGLICAFGSAIVFVSSNIFFKKIMPSPSAAPNTVPNHKLDKLNLLFYSSGLAFLLMIPLWLWSDLGRLLDHDHHPPAHHGSSKPAAHGVVYYFFMNGTVHWAQNIIAFAILSSTSPVTYSIASLIKRIVVILISIFWFSQHLHPIQTFGIALTFFGLWMYNNAKRDVERGENRMMKAEARMSLALPLTNSEAKMMEKTPASSPLPNQDEWSKAGMPTYSILPGGEVVMTSGSLGGGFINGGQSNGVGIVGSSIGGIGYANYASGHGKKQSLVSAQLVPPPMSSSKQHQLRLDVNPHHHYNKPLSPTESYPSPPASQDSPPPTTIPIFPTTQSRNRRPTIYESHSPQVSISEPATVVAI